ncbi:MAG: nitrilase, partial [Deinococcales bacterium]
DPQGEWLYGADIGIRPKYRGLGLSKLLYQARHKLVRQLKLKGHVAGGMLIGYGRYKENMSIEDYVAKLKRGELFDPTVSVQMRRGFRIKGIIYDYISDPTCDNKAALIVWYNPDMPLI